MDLNLKDLFESLLEILKLIFGGQIPPIVLKAFGWTLFSVSIIGLFWFLAFAISKILEIANDKIRPRFYNDNEKRRNLRRRRFADHIDNEIKSLNRQEAWSDYRFAELEAEVEAEGQRRIFSFIPFLKRTESGLRREKSLSKALANSEDRLILLEGEPGAGKSVALRHLTTLLAQKAAKSSNNKTPIPIYVNLKELRKTGRQIDRPQIYDFVLKSLNRVNDRDVEEFLEAEFNRGMQDGTWLFLFDSFDEIPDVLSSTEADSTIRAYANAISDFLHGMNQCRGVIASRQFRGPGAMGWPKFKVLQLSEKRQEELIKNSGMDAEKESIFLGMLGVASHEIRSMASNPMFLGLVCDHYKLVNVFPENPHSVFETYLNSRFTHDEERIRRRFGMGIQHLRALAENIAFCMAADDGLGLSPTRAAIKESLDRLKFKYTNLEKTLDSLEFMKIARSDVSSPGESKPFTFAHRRFQEYFATSVVLREPERVSARELLLNARWRETAVVVCQTQSDEHLSPIFENVTSMLQEMVASLKLAYPEIDYETDDFDVFQASVEESKKKVKEVTLFAWPQNTLHILGLLQSGFGSQLEKLPEEIRLQVGKIIVSGYKNGTVLDKKWALEVAGCSPAVSLTWVVKHSFESTSQFLKDVAYRQVARLVDMPDEIAKSIRLTLLGLFWTGGLHREKNATYAHLKRLPKSHHFLDTFKLLRAIPWIDLILIIMLFLIGSWNSYAQADLAHLWLVLAFFLPFCHWALLPNNGLNRYDSIGTIGIFVRIIILFIPAMIAREKVTFMFYITWAVISFFCLSWAFFSFFAVRIGKFLSPYLWVIMMIFPFVEIYKEMLRAIRMQQLRFFVNLFRVFSFFILLIIGFYYLYYFLKSIFEKLPYSIQLVLGVLVILFFGIFGIFGILFQIWKTSYQVYYHLRDDYILRKILKDQSFLSTQDFIAYHSKFSKFRRSKFVKTIRLKNMLLTSSYDIELLEWFCVFVENARFSRYSDYHKFQTIFVNKTGYINVKLPFKEYDSEFLDELYALLEQTSAQAKQD